MAAIDKIYLNSYQEYSKFKKWCLEQPKLKDKYGNEVAISSYLFSWWDDPKEWEEDKSHPVMSVPYYVDAYIIRNCPLEYIQKELMLNYGHKTQDDIDEMYNSIINRSPEDQKLIDDGHGECPSKPISWWWLSKDDFEVVDNVVRMPILEKSDYEKIKDGELYASPTLEGTYEVGKHFKIIKRPFYQRVCNYPIRYRTRSGVVYQPDWSVKVQLPEEIGEYMWWHDKGKHKGNIVGTWDFPAEFVSDSEWSSSETYSPSLKSIKRRILKWKLPVGTIVTLQGRYVGEEYEILVKK